MGGRGKSGQKWKAKATEDCRGIEHPRNQRRENHIAIWVCLKIVYPIVPNGFADPYPYEQWLAIIGGIPNIFRQTHIANYSSSSYSAPQKSQNHSKKNQSLSECDPFRASSWIIPRQQLRNECPGDSRGGDITQIVCTIFGLPTVSMTLLVRRNSCSKLWRLWGAPSGWIDPAWWYGIMNGYNHGHNQT